MKEMNMRVSTQLLATVMTSLALLGCQATAPGPGILELREVRIESHPKGWGYAHKTVKPDGSITGGHLSGGENAPRVYESSARVTEEDMTKLKKLAAAIAPDPADTPPSRPNQKLEGYTSVVIIFTDGTSRTVFAILGQRFQPDAIATIFDTIGKYNVGAW